LISVDELSDDFSGNSGAAAISAMAYSPINTDYRYVMNGNGDFFTSTDGGASWIETTGFDGPDGNYLYGAEIIPSQVELGKIYVGGSGYSNPPAFVSTDNGASFTAINNGIPNTMIFEMVITSNDEYLFAATEVGPYVYIPENNQWYDLAQAIAPDQTYWSVDYLPITKTVRFGTYGRGIWDFVIENDLVSINEKNNTEINIYPNPADDHITVQYAMLEKDDAITINIVDMQGRTIKTIKSTNQIDEITIAISELKSGFYNVNFVSAKQGKYTVKISKK